MIIVSLCDCFLQQKKQCMTYIHSKKPTRIYGAKTFFIHCSLYITIEREKTHAIFEKNIKKVFHLVIIHLSIPYGLKHISKPY